jgi:hypothetical protein
MIRHPRSLFVSTLQLLHSFIHSSSLVALLALCFPVVTLAGPNAGGVLLVHCNPATEVPGEATFVEGGLAACDSAVVQAPADSTVLWFLYAAFPASSSPRVAVVSFGCQFDADSVGILWSAAPPGSTALRYEPDAGGGVYWPYPGTGELLGFATPLTGTLNEIYCFAGYGPQGESFSVVANPDSVQGGGFSDDGTPSLLDDIADFGSLGFGVPGSVPCPQGLDSPGGPNGPTWPDSPGNAEAGLEPGAASGDCVPNVVIIRFAPNVISFPDEDPELKEHFIKPLADAEFVRSSLDSALTRLGVETFETVAPGWRHLTDADRRDLHGSRINLIDFTDVYRIALDGTTTLDSVVAELSSRSDVEYAECDYPLSFETVDSLYDQQWYLSNTGQQGCAFGLDVNAPEAWALQDSAGTKIGICDTQMNRWVPGIAQYVDTLLSRSFVGGESPWSTEAGKHATRLASIAATGTFDSFPLASIPNLPRSHDDRLIVNLHAGYDSEIAAALSYVTSPPQFGKIRVFNSSFAAPKCKRAHNYSVYLRDGYHNAFVKGIVLTCSSGNELWCDLPCTGDTCVAFPAAFVDLTLAVGAVDCQGAHEPTYYQGSYIDMAAPAKGIWYLDVGGPAQDPSIWTSYSSPMVGSAAMLLLGADPELTNEDCYNILTLTSRPASAPRLWVGAGILDVGNAIAHVKTPRHVVHDSTSLVEVTDDGDHLRPVYFRNAGPFTRDDTAQPLLVDRYRLTWTATLLAPDTAWVEHVWARGRTSSGWRKIDSSIDDYYDGHFYASHADVAWSLGTTAATFTSYAYKVYTPDSVFLGWAPFDPTDLPDTAQVTYSYILTSTPPAGVAAPEAVLQSASVLFRPATNGFLVQYRVPGQGPVEIEIFDVAGRSVRRLRHEGPTPGTGVVSWDGRDASGRRVPSGLYLARLHAEGRAAAPATGRVVVVR